MGSIAADPTTKARRPGAPRESGDRGRRAKAPVMGVVAPGPRPTPLAIWLMLRYVGLPLVGALFLLDVLIWALGEVLFGRCLALWC